MRIIDADKLQDYFLDNRSKLFQSKDCRIAIDNVPTVEAIPKADYEARLKADLKAILVELQLEIEEIKIDNNVPSGFEPVSKTSAFYEGVSASSKIIQQKINKLKGDQEGEE